MHNLKIVLDDFYYQVAEWKYLFLWKKIINNYESCFCDKYINITKIVRGKHTDKIMLLVWLVFLELLYPYIPHFVSAIKTKFNVDWQWVTINDIQNIQLKEKNYKINIFMELVDKVVSIKDKLWIKKHEFADIAIQANPDLLNFLKENESIFRLLTKIHGINLFRDHEEIPNWYMVDNVINIVIWVKKSVKIEGKKDVLVDLQTEYNEKIEHLQHLKSLFASVYGDGENELVNKKRQEISDLQADIEDLEFKIWKLKMDKI